MKRIMVLASCLGLLGSILCAQNTNTPDTSGTPWAQATVTPGPQGLPVVNTYFAPWPLGTALQDSFSQGSLPSGSVGSSGSPQAASSGPGTGSSSPVENRAPSNQASPNQVAPNQAPPAAGQNGGTGAQNQNRRSVQSPAQPQPAASSRTQQTSSSSGSPQASPQGSKRTVVVPSPVHYDRAGRRVIDPSWQETMYQMIEADRASRDRETQRDTQGIIQETPAAASNPSNQGSGPEVQDVRPVRETVFVVPGPAIWRIRGTLTVAKGMLALEDDDSVLWYLPGLDRYIGFIDGLDAGQRAALEGYAPPRGSSQERYFQPIKLFIDEMEYDLAIPPEGMYLGGQTTIIREIERPAAVGNPPLAAVTDPAVATNRDTGSQTGGNEADPKDRDRTDRRSRDRADTGRRDRRDSPVSQPVWEHRHTSPWAPPTSVLDFKMDYDSFWQDDPARQERRERDSRGIWY